jgi:hydroxyethylthiazole kinase
MNTTANALLALGASPVMAHAPEEVAEFASMARALVLNIGTLSAAWIDSMFRAGAAARSAGRPIVLDPVGAGATPFRTGTARRLLAEFAPTIVRGNASEIRALVADEHGTKGVDSTHDARDAIGCARTLACTHKIVVTVSGATDYIVSADAMLCVSNGHALMPRVTGLGCTATALCAAFAAVNPAPLDAAAHAMAVMGIAGEIAAEQAAGPGTFLVRFMDALYGLAEADLCARLRMEPA